MVFAIYFLFILVMMHALVALPFPGQGYYGHKVLKYDKRRPVDQKMQLSKMSFLHSWFKPSVFSKQSKLPRKGFSSGYSFWNTPSLSTYWIPPSSVGKTIGGVPSKRLPFLNSMPKDNARLDISTASVEPYSFFKSPYVNFPPLKQVPEISKSNTKKHPKIFEISFAKTKPNILLVKESVVPFVQQKEFKPVNVGFKDTAQPKPKSDQKLMIIDIVNNGNDPAAKDKKPIQDIDYFNVVSVPVGDITKVNDVPTNAEVVIPKVDISKPNSNDNLAVDIPIEFSVDAQVTVLNGSPVNINGESPSGNLNQDLKVVPLTIDATAPTEIFNIDTAVTVGDIPGFIVDGGSPLDARNVPIYVANEIPRNDQGINVINGLVSVPGNANILTGSKGIDLNHNDIAPTFGGNELVISGTANSNGFVVSPDIVNIDVQSGIVVSEEPGLNGNSLLDAQSDQNLIGNVVTEGIQPIDSGIIDMSATNEISSDTIPGGNTDGGIINTVSNSVNTQEESAAASEEDTNNQGIGSVVIIRPVSFLMKAEPFGPGPYGQCRAPSRVVCGVRFGWEHVTGMVGWCQQNCIVFMYSSYCDDDRCQCKCI